MGVAHSQTTVPSLRIYNCVDASGRTVSSDRPIKECSDREQRILGGGSIYQTGVLPPSYTDDERAALREKEQQRQAQKRSESEARQRLRLLEMRYPDRAAFTRDRASATTQIEAVISTANAGLRKLHTAKANYAQEVEFYQGGTENMPTSLRARIDNNLREIAEQENFIAKQEQEKERIQARYDADLPLLEAIWAGKATQ